MAASAASVNDLECGMCLEIFRDPRILPCGHSFCLECLQKKIGTGKTTDDCASCRVQFCVPPQGMHGLPKNFSLMGLIDKMDLLNQQLVIPSSAPPYEHPASPANSAPNCPAHPSRTAALYCMTCQCFACSLCSSAAVHSGHNGIEMRNVAAEFEKILLMTGSEAAKMMDANEHELSSIQELFSAISHDIEKKHTTNRQRMKRCTDAMAWPLAEQAQMISKLPKFCATSIISSSKWIQNVRIERRIQCTGDDFKHADINILSVRENLLMAGSSSANAHQVMVFDKNAGTVVRTISVKKKLVSAALVAEARVMCVTNYDVTLLPSNDRAKDGLKKPYILSANRSGELFISDFSSGFHQYDNFKNEWKSVVRFFDNKQCWHIINIDRRDGGPLSVTKPSVFWVVEYRHSSREFQLQEYLVTDKSVEFTQIPTRDDAGRQIELGSYGLLIYGCCRMVYDGDDTVYLREYNSEGRIHVFCVSTKSYLCSLNVVGSEECKGIAYDPTADILYVGQKNGVVLACTIGDRQRYHELRVAV